MKIRSLKLNSIRNKLIISLITICVIPLIILGLGSYYQSKSILSNKLVVTSTQTLNEVNSDLTDYFEGFTKLVSTTAKNPSVEEFQAQNNDEIIKKILQVLKDSDNNIPDVYYGTENGKFAIYPEQKMPDGYDARRREWYKIAVQNKGKVVITPPYKDMATGKMVVGIVEAVEKDSQLVGVIGIDCELTALTEKIATKKIGNSGYAFIAESSGNIVAHPDNSIINTDEAVKLPIWNTIQSNNNGFIAYNYDNAKKFGVYQTNELTGWKLVATLDENELSNDTKSILLTTLVIILLMALVSIAMSLILSKGISDNIKKLKKVFGKASDGDLTVTIKTKTNDEFKDLALEFNSMMRNILHLMKNVTESSKTVLETSTSLASMSEEISDSISEVAKAIEAVSTGAGEQVENAQQGTAKMEELSQKIDEISTSSIEMDKISDETKKLSSKGLSMLSILIEKSNKAKSSTNKINDIVQDMNESTKQINAISETIGEITEQTNLLSLNASIESARAGEVGKGFAVVADEIRKLAEQSKTSTEEIKTIITKVQEKSDVAVKAIELAKNVVNEQDEAVNETKKIFNEILGAIEIMIKKVDEIKISVNDVDKKKQSTVSKIENISFISEQTATASEEVTASAEEISATMQELSNHSNDLKVLAEQLESEVGKFKTNQL